MRFDLDKLEIMSGTLSLINFVDQLKKKPESFLRHECGQAVKTGW